MVGAGMGPVTPAASALLARLTPAEWMALSVSIRLCGVPAGVALAGALLPAIAVGIDWRAGVVAVAFMCGALAWALHPDALVSPPPGRVRPL